LSYAALASPPASRLLIPNKERSKMPELEDQLFNESLAECDEAAGESTRPEPKQKKPFVEPTISVPVDVLEATTYFLQIPVDSGSL
jgi:hypothetical protein